jgi:hypothetical protein
MTPKESDLSKCPECGGEADNGTDRCDPPNVFHCTKCEAPKESGWRERVRDWWYSIQDAAPFSHPESKRVELEHIIRDAEATAIAATEAREREAHKEAMGEVIMAERTQQMIRQREGDFGYDIMFAYHAKDEQEAKEMKELLNEAFQAIARSRGVLEDDNNK